MCEQRARYTWTCGKNFGIVFLLKNCAAIKFLKTTHVVFLNRTVKIWILWHWPKTWPSCLGIKLQCSKRWKRLPCNILIWTCSIAMEITYKMKLRVQIIGRFLGAKANEMNLDNETTRFFFQQQETKTDMSPNFWKETPAQAGDLRPVLLNRPNMILYGKHAVFLGRRVHGSCVYFGAINSKVVGFPFYLSFLERKSSGKLLNLTWKKKKRKPIYVSQFLMSLFWGVRLLIWSNFENILSNVYRRKST